MTNKDKYKNDKERAETFNKFCSVHLDCNNCLCTKIGPSECSYIWLEIDTEELEKERKLEEEKGVRDDE